ncbi:hypothetical protein KIW84_055937 [Lathyrus oleraceus]|uniref:Uncharacterized protein n=1 Tax=Pisum sativum TaxID=3888 RepID=A0A9D4WZ09_PEA|nr:hypothetical protein KIW84_055937 [Pisum sativum]
MWCTAIYSHNNLEQRRKLWKDIEDIHSHINGPWFLMCDYNHFLHAQDRIGGNHVHEAEYRDLVHMMDNIELFEKESIGDHFTWSNKHGNSTVYSRIDKVFALYIMEPWVFDHALLPGETLTDQVEMKNEILRFCGELVGYAANNLQGIDFDAIRKGSQLSAEQCGYLTKSVTEDEICRN